MIGFFETVIEYYTGRDASALSDDAFARKIRHIYKIRKMEAEEGNGNVLKKMFG